MPPLTPYVCSSTVSMNTQYGDPYAFQKKKNPKSGRGELLKVERVRVNDVVLPDAGEGRGRPIVARRQEGHHACKTRAHPEKVICS